MRFPLLHRIPRESKVAAVVLAAALLQVGLLAALGLRSTGSRLAAARADLLTRTRQAVRRVVEDARDRVDALEHEASRELLRHAPDVDVGTRVSRAVAAVDALAEMSLFADAYVVEEDGRIWHCTRPLLRATRSSVVDEEARAAVAALAVRETAEPEEVRREAVALADRIEALPPGERDLVAIVLALRVGWRAAFAGGDRNRGFDPIVAVRLAERVLVPPYVALLDDRDPVVADREPFGVSAAAARCHVLAEVDSTPYKDAFVEAVLERRRLSQSLGPLLSDEARVAESAACREVLAAHLTLAPDQRRHGERGLAACERIDRGLALLLARPFSVFRHMLETGEYRRLVLSGPAGPTPAFVLQIGAGLDGSRIPERAAVLLSDPDLLREYALTPLRRDVDLPLGASLLVRDEDRRTYEGDPEAPPSHIDQVPIGDAAPGLSAGAILASSEVDQAIESERIYWLLVLAGTSLAVVVAAFLAIRALRRELRLARMKSDFVSNLSHELRTPLTSLRMFVETLLEGRVRGEEEKRECLEVISQETNRLARLVDRILQFAAYVKGRAPIAMRQASVADTVNRAVDLFRSRAEAASATLELRVEPNLPETVLDRDALIQVILNLLDNAVKYAGESGARIEVTVRPEGRGVAVEVEDDGPGVPERERDLVFEEFYRGNDMLSGPVQGTGIGLALSRRIVLAHGGKIQCRKSRRLGGALLRVLLPDAATARRLIPEPGEGA